MIAKVIDGISYAESLTYEVSEWVRYLSETSGFVPGLVMIVLGNNPVSSAYVSVKSKKAKMVGMHSCAHWLSECTTQHTILSLINELNDDDRVDGILVQLPLPSHISGLSVSSIISSEKDVDGLGIINTGRLFVTNPTNGLIPCTPLACMRLLKAVCSDLSGLNAVILGRSRLVGRPMSQLLLNEDCTVTIAHSRTGKLREICKRADILVVAVGVPGLVKADWVKPGAIVIDVGINYIADTSDKSGASRIVGDVDFSEVRNVAGAITPVPGGVGPMTVSVLLANTLVAAMSRRGLRSNMKLLP